MYYQFSSKNFLSDRHNWSCVIQGIMRSDLEAASVSFNHLPGSALLLCSWNSTLYCSSCKPVSSVFPVTNRRLRWLHVWKLTKVDFGGSLHEVGVRGSLSQICSQVCTICGPSMPAENAPDVWFVYQNQKRTLHYYRCSAPKMLGLVCRLRLIFFFGKFPVINIFNLFFFYLLWFTLWSYKGNGLT